LFAVPSETGVNTNTWKLPTVWIRPAGTVAVSCVGLTYILAKVVPFPPTHNGTREKVAAVDRQ